MRNSILIICLLTIFSGPLTAAREIAGVNLPDTMTIQSTETTLNGAGLRKKMFIKVYAGALYLTNPSSDAKAICDADEPMAIRMHFIYDGVSSEKLVAAWNEGFANMTGGTSSLTKEIATFNGFYTNEAKVNDIHDLVYEPGKGVTVTIDGQIKGTIPGLAFKKALFGIWLGDVPADKALKEEMLGK